MSARGFTLIELLVAMTILGILGLGMVNLFVAQHQTYALQNQGVLATQNARAGFDMLAREMRNAGLDPRRTSGAGVTLWDADGFGWTADLNADGDIADTDEAVRYFHDPTAQTLVRREGGIDAVVADGITSLAFQYFSDVVGTPAATAGEIEQVAIAMTYATPEGVLPGALETRVALRNQIYR